MHTGPHEAMTAATVILAWLAGWALVGLLSLVACVCIRPRAFARLVGPVPSLVLAAVCMAFGPFAVLLIISTLQARDEDGP